MPLPGLLVPGRAAHPWHSPSTCSWGCRVAVLRSWQDLGLWPDRYVHGNLHLWLLPHGVAVSRSLVYLKAQIDAFVLVCQRSVSQLFLVWVSWQGSCVSMNPVPCFTAAEPDTPSSKKPVKCSQPFKLRDSQMLKHLATVGLS